MCGLTRLTKHMKLYREDQGHNFVSQLELVSSMTPNHIAGG